MKKIKLCRSLSKFILVFNLSSKNLVKWESILEKNTISDTLVKACVAEVHRFIGKVIGKVKSEVFGIRSLFEHFQIFKNYCPSILKGFIY